jgi:hypothetical protein
MFSLCFFTRLLRMNIFIYTVLNADIPVIYVEESVYFHVKYVIEHSLKTAD